LAVKLYNMLRVVANKIPGVSTLYRVFYKLSRPLADIQFFTLAKIIEESLSKLSSDPVHNRRKYLYARREAIKASFYSKDLAVQQYPIFLINREKDKMRLKRISHRCKKLGIRFNKFIAVDLMTPGFDFRPFKQFIADTYYGSSTFKKGAIGCYLSHYLIWKHIAENNIEYSIILEDDAYPLIPFPKTVDLFHFPDQFDVVFINSSLGNIFAKDVILYNNKSELFDCYPLKIAYKCLFDENGSIGATGAYGYAISKKGALKLLRIITDSKICCGVDSAIVSHSMTNLFRENFINNMLNDRRKEKHLSLSFSNVKLDTYILFPSLVDHRGKDSTIAHEDPSALIERSDIDI
jgi:GR25 family glycosyltransferase involved in LPS biosynthesis